MFSDNVKNILQRKLSNCPQMFCSSSLARDIDELVASVLPPMKLAVVDDARTATALGDLVYKALKGRFPAVHIMLEAMPVADDITAQFLRTQTISCDALIAVGSGTINDLCKYVSHLDQKPYIVFPTSASMNGYSSANASIKAGGYKKTFKADMPRAIFCDMSVIAAAPKRFSKAGFGDSIARPTAQADWLLSHLMLGTAYDETPFHLTRDIEAQLFDEARGIALGDKTSIELLMQNLLLCGLGMTIAGGSFPASQGEHMIAHAYEMANESDALHGETIAVTTLYMAQLQETLLQKKPALRLEDFPDTMRNIYGEKPASEAKKAFAEKRQLMQKAKLAQWELVAEKISAIHLPLKKLETIAKTAELPMSLKKIGWNNDAYDTALKTARYLRERFGFLDLI